jgi:glycosyltransferase involved in cell wall biosynthesis
MRVLVLENEPSSRRGGQELSLLDVCQGLAARGHHIELLHTADGNLLERYRGFSDRIDRVKAYAVDRSRTVRSALRLLSDAMQPGRPAPDVIYANQYLDSLFARLLSWRFRRPFVCHVRLPPPDMFCGQYRWGMNGAVRLIAISKQTRDDYAARGFRSDRIDVVHNGIDMRACRPSTPRAVVRERLGIDPQAFLAVFAGRLHPGKGIDVLIDAVASLPPSPHLVIAGQELQDGSGRHYEQELRDRAETSGLASRCHFVGHVEHAADLFAAADVVVLPSLISEAFGRVVIEAMCCETPVVASRIGGIPEILTGEFEHSLFEPGDVSGLAVRLLALRSWRQRDPELGRRCRAHVEDRFDVTRMVAGVEASLQSAVDEWNAGAPVWAASAAVR